jgi:aminoglycoside phosphotransferase
VASCIGNSQREILKFQNEEEFHRYLDIAWTTEDKAILKKAHSIQRKIVFTHADINMRIVLVDENGRISGIVDWECAGWYPEYWEYTKMHFGARVTSRWIADVIDRVFPGYRDELRAEDVLAAIAPPW